MAEFMTSEEGLSMFGSNGKANAGLTLGIIGTALGALNSGLLGNNGILGLGGNGSSANDAALGVSEMNTSNRLWELSQRLDLNQLNDIYLILQAKIDALQGNINLRDRDITEKIDVYKQSVSDNNKLNDKIDSNREYTTQGLIDVYKLAVVDNKSLAATIAENLVESMKNDSLLELKLDSHRETDIKEKFDMYKEFTNQTNKLAYDSMRQSYEDRMEAYNQMSNLSNRISALETATAVNKATQPLLFLLSAAKTDAELNTKVTGNLGIKWDQIYGPNPVFGMPVPPPVQ